jgi:hypothetical protein
MRDLTGAPAQVKTRLHRVATNEHRRNCEHPYPSHADYPSVYDVTHF